MHHESANAPLTAAVHGRAVTWHEAERRRDELLAAAREAVQLALSAGADPADGLGLLQAAWAAVPGPDLADADFQRHPAHAVESLAFLVRGGAQGDAGGLVFRLVGEHPDSFEAVRVPSGSSLAMVRAVYVGSGRRG